MQAQDRIFDMRGIPVYAIPTYARIEGLLNPLIWVENDADWRVFLYVDSIVISQN